ncbi:MAG: hypothetical protein ACI4AA_08240 [Lachnospiraceae bacterium]
MAEKEITFQELLTKTNTSRSTLYRDLLQFQDEGIVFVKNGIITFIGQSPDSPFSSDKITIPIPKDYAQQRSIATIAANMISEMDSIFIGEGLLCLLLAQKIHEQKHLKNVTVVTNNFSVALELSSFIGHLYLLGGDVLQNSDNIYTGGPRIESNLSTIFVSKAFASVDGIDFQSGYTMHELSQLSILSHLPDFSAQTIFLIPSCRFGYNSIHQLAPINFSDVVITDSLIDIKYQKAFLTVQKPKLIIA